MKVILERFLSEYEEELVKAAKKLCASDESINMPKLTEELFSEFERNGNRLNYEKVYFERRRYLSVLGILVSLYGKEIYLHRLEAVIADICNEECWALPAHVDRNNNGNWRITIDLFSAETACSIAELVGRLKGRISDEVYELAKREVFRRVLTPFINSEEPYAWWETSNMNWCPVCVGSIGIAAMWLMDDKVRLDKLLRRLCNSIMNYIDGFSEDGACLEGLGYYTYGMSFFVAFADMVEKRSAGNMNLFKASRYVSDKFRRIALFQQKCYLPGNVTLSFSDSSQRERFRVGLTSYLAMLYEDIVFPDISMAAGLEADNCYRYLILSRDVIFTRRYLEYHFGNGNGIEGDDDVKVYGVFRISKEHTVLPDAQWSICQSENSCAVAVKGGHNDEPHNHNDIGSFVYVCDGEYILTDLGAGEYTKAYFDDRRYTNLCCSSRGHNVPIIDSMEQQAGAQYKASCFMADGRGRTVVCMEKAYELEENEKIIRTVSFDMESGKCTITDEFLLHQGRTITESLISPYKPQLEAGIFYIAASHNSFEINCQSGSGHNIVKECYRDHYGNERTVWLLQWNVSQKLERIEIRQWAG